MPDVVVLVPVLNRPHRVTPLLASLYASQADFKLSALFICSPGDEAELEAVDATGENYVVMSEPPGPGDYARKMNAGARFAAEEADWIFLGADDLCFCVGWADEAIRVGLRKRCRVVGTNDLGNRQVMVGNESTHTLVASSYVAEGTIDDPSVLLHEGYTHNYVDTEFVGTARARREFTAARRSWVEHMHPAWRKADMDSTYRIALDPSGIQRDAALYGARRHLWEGSLERARVGRRYR